MTTAGRGLTQACWAVGSTLRVQPGKQIPLVTLVSMPWKESSHLSVIEKKWSRSGSGERGVGEWWKVIDYIVHSIDATPDKSLMTQVKNLLFLLQLSDLFAVGETFSST